MLMLTSHLHFSSYHRMKSQALSSPASSTPATQIFSSLFSTVTLASRCCGVKNQDDPSGLPQVHPGDLTSGGQYKYEKGQFLKWRGSNKPYWKWIEKGAEER
jgi:hypothetical protein